MTNRAVVLWLLAALVAGALAVFLLHKPASKASSDSIAAGQRVAEFAPGTVVSITIATADGRKDTVVKGDGDTWTLVIGSMKTPGSPTSTWPLSPARVRN